MFRLRGKSVRVMVTPDAREWPLLVHVVAEPQPRALRPLCALLQPGVRLTVGDEPDGSSHFRILVAGVPTSEQLEASPELRVLIIPWSGLPQVTRTLMLKRPQVAVHNLHHNAGPAAELAVALLLAAAKFIVPMDRSLRAGDWMPRYRPSPAILLNGRCALVLGFGSIGRRVAGLCHGLGMRVVAVRRRPELTSPDCPYEVHGPDHLDDLLPQANVLIACLPLTDKTRGLIGERQLALLPCTSVLVNVGRGAVIQEAPLYEALRCHQLGAAGLDVWYTYPSREEDRSATPPSAYPFSELDNVVLSPHRAGAIGEGESEVLRMEALAASLNAAAVGDEIPHRVDLSEGY